MAVILFLFALVAIPRWAFSDVQLVSSGPGTLRPGENLHLVCKVSGFSISTLGYDWHWIRQPPGKGLEWVAGIYPYAGSKYVASSLQSRVTISADTSKNQFSLQLNSLTAADSAVYFYTRGWYSYWYFDYWGQGTMVTVTSATQSGPSLFPLILPSEKIPRNGPVTVGCLAKDVPPALVRFTWEDHNNGSINSSSIKQYPTVGNSAGTFTASSQMTVSAEDWENFQPFYCKAENVNGSARIVRRAAQTEPKLIIRGPRQQDFKNPNKNANIVCVGSHMHDASTTVQWLKDGNILDSGFTTTGSAAAGCGGYSVVSELAVSKADWSADKKFSCRVHNKMFSRTENISSSMICDSDCPGDIVEVHVETIPPSFVDIYLTKSANLTCRISNLPEEEDLKELHVTWTRVSDKKELDTVIGQVKRQENSEMFFVDATATICKEEWDKDAFECKVTHHLLPAAEIKTLRKLHGGTPHAPAVYVLPPPSEQLALQETATITCLVKGFYPNDFFVKWMRNDEPVGPSEYFTSQPIQESKTPERYFAYSTLNVKEQDWSYGATYTCVVGHEALPLQMSQKTLDKNTGKPTLVNVSLVLSDIASSCH